MATDQELYDAWYIWRPVKPKRAKKSSNGSGFASVLIAGAGRPSTRQTSAQLGRLERRSPQVMVKVTKPTFGAAHTYQSMTYMSRNCREEIIDQDDETYGKVADLGLLAERWVRDNREARLDGDRRTNQPDARRIQFSMPPGTDADKLRNAVAATARHLFGGKFDYVYALHTDRPHPHVHLAIRTMSTEGASLRINKDNLIYMRRTLAMELRMRGIDADATPQIARGVRVRRPRDGVYRDQQRTSVRVDKAAEIASGPVVDEAYRTTAKKLLASSIESDKALARRIGRYADKTFAKHKISGRSIAELEPTTSSDSEQPKISVSSNETLSPVAQPRPRR